MKPILYRLWIGLLLIMALFILVFSWILITETGTTVALRTVQLLLPNQLSFSATHGRLIDALSIDNLHYKSSNLELRADYFLITWRPLPLLHGKLLVDNLQINNAKISIKKSTANIASLRNSKNTNYSLLFTQIKRLQLKDISLEYADYKPVFIKNLTAQAQLDQRILLHVDAQLTTPLVMNVALQLIGTPKTYQWRLALQNAQSNWAIAGLGGQTGLSFNTTKNALFDGQLFASGQIDWSPVLHWQLSTQAKALDLKFLATLAPQRLDFTANSHGTVNAFVIDVAALQALQKNGLLHGYIKLHANQANAKLDSKRGGQPYNFQLDTLFALKNTYLSLKGGLAERWNLAYKLNIADMHNLAPTLNGSINLTGTTTGIYNQPHAHAVLTTKDLSFSKQKGLSLQGDLSVDSLARLDLNTKAINAQILLKKLQLNYVQANKILHIPLNGFLQASVNQQGLTAQMKLGLANAEFIQAKLSLPNYRLTAKLLPEQTLQANLASQLNLDRLSVLFGFKTLDTQLATHLQMTGSIAHPQLHGDLDLRSTEVELPQPAIKLQNLQLHIKMANQLADYQGSATLGPGIVKLIGKTQLKNNRIHTVFAVNGEQLLVSNSPTLKIYLSPQLQIQDQENGWRITGKIAIPRAYIKLADASKVVTLPPETVIVAPAGAIAPPKALSIFSDIQLLLGDKVQLETSGLNSLVMGNLHLKDYPDSEIRANGQLNLTKGDYDLQGQKLKLVQSAFTFINSPLSNPNLDIRAIKTISYAPSAQTQTQKFNVGMHITGTAENPRISLFSDPPSWSQPDILALILLGQPASQASGASLSLLATAAKTLIPQQSSGISQLSAQLQQFFGLSEFGIESGISSQPGATSSSSFVVGKQLSPRLYLSYSLSLLNSINTLRLRYLLTKHWFIQSQANTLGSGVDLLYSIEH